MDIHSLKKEIANGLDALNEQTDNILEFPGRIPQIEIDIAMGNMRKLYESFCALGKLNEKTTRLENKTRKTIITDKPVSQKPIKKIVEPEEVKPIPPKPKMEVVLPPPIPKKETIAKPQAPKIETKPEPVKEKPSPEPKPEVKSKVEQTTEVKEAISVEKPASKTRSAKPTTNLKEKYSKENITTADLYENQSTLADKFMVAKDKSLGAQMQNNKITDLKKSIGINERFLFVNDLFDGSMPDYNYAIENLNSMGTRQQAHSVINNLAKKYGWEGKPDAFNHFLQYIERRFADV